MSTRLLEWARAFDSMIETRDTKEDSISTVIDEKLRRLSERFPFVSLNYFVREKLQIWRHKPDA